MRYKKERRNVEVLAVAGIWAMIRRGKCAPYVCHVDELYQQNAAVEARRESSPD